MDAAWPGWLATHFHGQCMEFLHPYRLSISYLSSIQHSRILVLGCYRYILNCFLCLCLTGLHYRGGTLSLRYSLFLQKEEGTLLFVKRETLLHLPWLPAANITLRNDLSKEWLGSCILDLPARTCRNTQDSWLLCLPIRTFSLIW